ncbi:MAG: TonB-dependent receptor [Acidobacteria bacterium]|nr:TonB-dependent receptor [Acidobacteriota bacterium]
MLKIAAGVTLGALISLAQSPTATISGIVQDAQGAVVAGARIQAVHGRTSARVNTESNATGLFSLRQLDIGDYSVEVEHTGFRRYVRSGIRLTTGQSLELNVTLELGAVTESVTVSAAASLLDTRTSEVSQLVESKAVEDLPLGDRRSMNLVQITGAAVFVNYDSGQKPNFSLAGGRTQRQMFWIDGGTGQNMRLGAGQVDLDPPVETLQEVKILSSSMAAEYGGSAGGNVVVTTKSGTNQFHGSAFEYVRNEKFDAPNFFAPIADGRKQRAPLRYNVFGGTIGGPVRKDRTFFFFGYEGSRRRDGLVRTLTVPTEVQKAGDFSQTVNAQNRTILIYDPATTAGNTRQPFAGNRIPAARVDPVAAKLLPFYPVANREPDAVTGANNFRSNYVNSLTRNNYTARVDHTLSSKDRLTGRFLYNSDDMSNSSVFPDPGADTLNSADRHQNYWYGTWTRTFAPTVLNDFRFTYSNRINHAKSAGLGGDYVSRIGLRGVESGAFPLFAAAGFTSLGSNNQERRQFPIEQYQVVDNFSWIRGRHSFKFGAEARKSMNYEVARPMFAGAFNFGVLPTGLPGNAQTGSGLATMMVGFPTAFNQRETEVLNRSSWYLAGFAQDDWSLHRDFTLNIGVRWETDTPVVDANNRMNGFDLNAVNPVSGTPGVVRFMGVNGFRTSPFDTDWNNFGPRLGFAWKPFGSAKWVIRGAYGIFYAEPENSGPTGASLGFDKSVTLNTPDNGITAPFFLRDGVPRAGSSDPVRDDRFGAVRVGSNATTAVTFFETDRKTGYSQQFNLGVQRELPGNMVVELKYLGNVQRKLPSPNLTLNQIHPSVLGPGRSSQRDRPYPQFSDVSVIGPTLGIANYHAGVARFERRFSKGFSVLSTYTWSKNLNNSSEGAATIGAEGGVYSNAYNRRADYGPSGNDIAHRFTMSGVWELPSARNRWRWLAGGWSVGTLGTLQTGSAFSVGTQVNTTNAFAAGGLRADVSRNPNLPTGERTLGRWFDTGAFSQPALFQFGNQGVSILRADGIINFDFSVLRNFALGEGRKLQFRGEFFNAPNHPNFEEPGLTFGAPGFGIVSAAGPARRIQFGLRLVF